LNFQVYEHFKKVEKAVKKCKEKRMKMKHELSNRLEKEIKNFKKEILELDAKCDEFIEFND
jgi:predicted RNase H-like nuclease (RuvC/YqgF family)